MGHAHFSGVSQSPKIALPNPWRKVNLFPCHFNYTDNELRCGKEINTKIILIRKA